MPVDINSLLNSSTDATKAKADLLKSKNERRKKGDFSDDFPPGTWDKMTTDQKQAYKNMQVYGTSIAPKQAGLTPAATIAAWEANQFQPILKNGRLKPQLASYLEKPTGYKFTDSSASLREANIQNILKDTKPAYSNSSTNTDALYNQILERVGKADTGKYDIMRTGIRRESEQERDALRKEIARRLQSRGFGEGSAMLERSETQSDIASYGREAGQIAQINIQQLSDQEQRDFQAYMHGLNLNKMDYQQSIDEKNNVDSIRSDSWYNKGIAGEELPDTELADLKTNDPLGYYAYQAGVSGKSREDYIQGKDMQMKGMSTALLAINPEDPGAYDQIRSIFSAFNIDLPDIGTAGQPQVSTEVTSDPTDTSKNLDLSGNYETEGNNQQNFSNIDTSKLQTGNPVRLNGKFYTISQTLAVNKNTGITKEYSYFRVKDSSGVEYFVVPTGLNITEVGDELRISTDKIITG